MKDRGVPVADSASDTLWSLTSSLLKTAEVDAVMVPSRIPSGESFAYLLVSDPGLLEGTTPLPPVMPVQGARALHGLGRGGVSRTKILCVLRPCEARAAVELFKRNQVPLKNVLLLTVDCPGAFPTRDYIGNPDEFDDRFAEVLRGGCDEGLRPNCRVCTEFSDRAVASDIHVGRAGGELIVVAKSDSGKRLLAAAGVAEHVDVSAWQAALESETEARAQARDSAFQQMADSASGPGGLEELLADCVNCHNCMRVCPICYCRQCLFDSADSVRIKAEDYLARAKHRGGIRFPGETMKFHVGRMYHMALSCVACGACEDACPMDVPVGRLFAFVGNRVQADFGYVPGRDREESMPMATFEEDELHAFEDAGGVE
jgi:formate dehydrogenase subunit beta